MTQEHPFAQYVRILGKGPNLSRPLTQDEAASAARMLLAGDVEPVQLGAFLCLLRVKTETPGEIAGFVQAAKEHVQKPKDAPAVDLSWPAFAGKSRQLPWFLLSALLLAGAGHRIFMYGAEDHTEGRLYAGRALAALGVSVATTHEDASRRLRQDGFAYMTLENICPPLHQLMGLRPILGLRSPIHSIGRMLNPFDARGEIVGVAHPAYRDVHQEAARLLGQPSMAVFKGEGGEAERRPEKPCEVFTVTQGVASRTEWPALANVLPPPKEETLDPKRLAAVWGGADTDSHAEAVIISTAAVALRVISPALSPDAAHAQAHQLWRERNQTRVPGAK